MDKKNRYIEKQTAEKSKQQTKQKKQQNNNNNKQPKSFKKSLKYISKDNDGKNNQQQKNQIKQKVYVKKNFDKNYKNNKTENIQKNNNQNNDKQKTGKNYNNNKNNNKNFDKNNQRPNIDKREYKPKQPKQKKPIFKGIFIANQRRKGRGGFIKCPQIKNKIQVRTTVRGVKRLYMHQTQVQFIEVGRYDRKARTIDGQCNCFLYEHQLNDFEHKQQKQKTPKKQLQLQPTKHHKQFKDLVFTIDPKTSTDLDDALSIKKINDNQYLVGIHISDVSQYLNKIPRQQLLKRTTSVYLPHKAFHMLPKHFVQIASLNPNVQRLAFTIFVKINKQAQIIQSKLQKNIIKSRFKLSYQIAQQIIQNKINYQQFNKQYQCSQDQFNQLKQKINLLVQIGLKHRSKRLLFQIFDNDQLNFQLDQQKWPINFSITSRFTAKKIVQQFMIMGNVQAAKKLTEYNQHNSLIIHHPPPTRRTQQVAIYKRYQQVSSQQGNLHFALGLRYYTHFTSPMRRFSDILVHENLNKIIYRQNQDKQLLQQQIQKANWGRKNTKRLKRDINDIYLCLYIYKSKKQIQTQGIITSFGGKSFNIYIPYLEMNKQILWNQMQVKKVFKIPQSQQLQCVLQFNKEDKQKNIVWIVQKFNKVKVFVGCTQSLPMRLNIQLQVTTKNGQIRKIIPKD